ncbi:MAG: sigma-70 family RNA polymerase sigma factor [Phycisphaerae bacterium]|nr:sigma-70 family RNA polymerase sigma factor [Phycisphaerae bacterium]
MDDCRLSQMELLAAQLKRGPKRLRLRQLLNIEFLLSVIEADKQYPYDFVCHGLTGYRPPAAQARNSRLLNGEDLIRDLVALAECLSEDANIPADARIGSVYSVGELSQRFEVSTKTIFRWRRRGLVGWKFRGADRRLRLAFPDRCVRRFVAQHADLVTRGSNFSQLTKAERQQIVSRAQELVDEGQGTVNAVARVISTEMGRAIETVRLILKHHDDAHPRAGIFNRSALQLDGNDERMKVWEAYVDGVSVKTLAQRFDKPVGWVYGTVTELRARDLRARKIEFVPSPEFEDPAADKLILEMTPSAALRQTLPKSSQRVPTGLPPYLAQLFRIPLLTKEGEVVLFRKMNYLKFKAVRLCAALDPETARASDLDRIEDLLAQAAAVKQEIVQANLRLVVGIAKRHVNATNDLFELISDGNVSLMRAVDKFDYMRGFKFSTYASWAIMKNFARSVPEQRRRRERYQTGWDEMLGTSIAVEVDEVESDHLVALRRILERMLATLDDRERTILQQRFGLDEHGQPQTLEQIGRQFGVSKERIRQLEARAMTKLRGGFQSDMQRLLGS